MLLCSNQSYREKAGEALTATTAYGEEQGGSEWVSCYSLGVIVATSHGTLRDSREFRLVRDQSLNSSKTSHIGYFALFQLTIRENSMKTLSQASGLYVDLLFFQAHGMRSQKPP